MKLKSEKYIDKKTGDLKLKQIEVDQLKETCEQIENILNESNCKIVYDDELSTFIITDQDTDRFEYIADQYTEKS